MNVPLGVIYNYYFRAKRSVTGLPISHRLHWLQAKDVEERSEWVSRFRESTIGDGCQVGAMTHRAALPLLPFNLDPDTHFNQGLRRAQQPLPYEDLPVSDLDLEYLADAYVAPRETLRPWRQHAVGALRELKRHWEGVTLHLHQVTRHRDMGFIALLLILTSWADTSFPYGLVRGLPAVGYAPPYNIFPQQAAEVISMSDVLQG